MFCSNPQLFVFGLYVVLMSKSPGQQYCTSELWPYIWNPPKQPGHIVKHGKHLLPYLLTQKQTTNEAKQKQLQNYSPIDNNVTLIYTKNNKTQP
jgi:hypothetical protein